MGGDVVKIRFLGTGASEAIPALFCECDTCKMARRLGGKNIRTRAQALVNDDLLIDFGPDTNYHAIQSGLELANIKHCLITHAHSDHLYLDDIEKRRFGFAYISDEAEPLTFYGSNLIYKKISSFIKNGRLYDSTRVAAKEIFRYSPFSFEDYTVTALDATHSKNTDPVIYMIEKDGKSLLYAHDTGLFPDSVWKYFKKTKPRFSLVSLDCTGGSKPISYKEHMNAERCKAIKEKLLEYGYADENTVFCLNHFSHNGIDTDFDTFCSLPQTKEFVVTYDGLVVEF